MDIINNLTERRAGTQDQRTAVAVGRAALAPPGRSCSPWIGKTQFWGRARGPLSIVTAQLYPIGPQRSLSTAYWFIDSGVDGNFGRATGPGEPPVRRESRRAVPARAGDSHAATRGCDRRAAVPCTPRESPRIVVRGDSDIVFPQNRH